MSDTIVNTLIWKKTLAAREGDKFVKERERLRSCFVAFRENVGVLSNEIHRNLPEFTVHDISHLDALWEISDIIIGENYDLTPIEAFVLGGAILLHDLGMALAAYPNGLEDITNDIAWKDILTTDYLSNLNRIPTKDEMINPKEEIKKIAISNILRKQHAEQAEKLATIYWKNASDGTPIFLINDIEIRQTLGRIIGKIANSHWWDIKRIENEFSRVIGAPAWCPREWTIDPLKIACIIRVADASHIDSRRAPTFLRTLRKLSLSSDVHWGFQEKLQKPYLREDSLNFSSGYAFSYSEASQWWLCYEALKLIDKELRQVDTLLADKNMQRFSARRVFGVESPERLISLIPVDGWFPFDAFVHIGDIPRIIRCLGGEELYGRNFSVAIRELIQNSSDAIRARRIIENRDEDWGDIIVSSGEDKIGDWIQVEDNGIGMSINVIKEFLLNFGSSYWESDLLRDEYPGLISSGIKQTGKYGIGFFSIFMLGNRIQVITKQVNAAQNDTYVLEFNEGINIRPIIRKARTDEYLRDGGTKIKVWLKDKKVKDNLFTNFNKEKVSLEELCLSIAPSLDCGLIITEDGKKSVYKANYWFKCDNSEFLNLLLKASKRFKNDEAEENKEFFAKIRDNFQLLVDENGEAYGRACIILPQFYYSSSYSSLTGILTIGGLAATRLSGIVGILKGKTITAARDISEPIVPKKILSSWASSQALCLKDVYRENDDLLMCSQIIRILGGENSELIVARNMDKWFKSEELVLRLENYDEIIVVDNYFLENRFKDLKNFQLNDNVILTKYSSVPAIMQSGRLQQYFFGEFENWNYKNTNLGFVIDAISKAWNIDINVLKISNKIKELKEIEVCIGKSDECEVYEDAYVFSKKLLSNI